MSTWIGPRGTVTTRKLRFGSYYHKDCYLSSCGSTLKTTVSRRPPLNAMCERSTPSRTNPHRAATRCDASLSGPHVSSSRARPSPENAHRANSRTARVATPRPRASAPASSRPRRVIARDQRHRASHLHNIVVSGFHKREVQRLAAQTGLLLLNEVGAVFVRIAQDELARLEWRPRAGLSGFRPSLR
jgi:hypothetical protein